MFFCSFQGGLSKRNTKECEIVKELVNRLLKVGIQAKDIGIITMYDSQVQLMKTKVNHPEVSYN